MTTRSNRRWLGLLLPALAIGTVSCGSSDSPTPVAESPGKTDPTAVAIADGKLEGDVMGDSVRFLKIPYAKPPVGALRWKAPQKNEPWTGVRHEANFASPCPQPPSQQSPASLEEDCLYLNVWRPNTTAKGAPVIVWIHGGGFTTGSAADVVPLTTDYLWYDGQKFAERGVVVVTINYRLGVLGFFAHPDLAAEQSPVGNQGLLDQRHALEWVRLGVHAYRVPGQPRALSSRDQRERRLHHARGHGPKCAQREARAVRHRPRLLGRRCPRLSPQ